VVCASSGRVVAFEEKGAHAGPGLVNAGVYLFRREALDGLPDRRPLSLELDVFPSWVDRGLMGLEQAEAFLDIGTPDRLESARGYFSNGSDDEDQP
jgi:NDP-sugar pyrophosphorylase family protein